MVQDSDWENNWREFYKPIEVGEKLVVVPDTAVMLLVALTFGQLSAMLYGFIKLYTCSRAMDAVLYGVVPGP